MLDFIKNIFAKKQYETLSPEDFQAGIRNTPKSMILDVRAKSEFDEEKIPNAVNIDIMNPTFKTRLAKMDKRKTYFVYCQKGGRSARACRTMTELGYESVYNLKGGINMYEGKTV